MHCLTCTDDQFHWVMMLAEVGQIREQSSNIDLLVDSGVACHVWPCKETWFISGRDVSDSTEVQLTAKAMFEFRFWVSAVLWTKEVAVVMGRELGNKICKNGRHCISTSPLVCITSEKRCWTTKAVSEVAAPWTRRFPYKRTEERITHLVSHLPLHFQNHRGQGQNWDARTPDLPHTRSRRCTLIVVHTFQRSCQRCLWTFTLNSPEAPSELGSRLIVLWFVS